MGQIQQVNPLQAKQVISAANLQEDLNQLFTTINKLDKDNLYAPGGVFDFGSLFLDGLQKIQINLGGVGSENRAVNKEYLEEQLDLKFDPGTGNWHGHDNKATLDDISDAGSGEIITTDERSRIASQDQKDAMENATSPDAGNPFATVADAGSSYSQSASTVVASAPTAVAVPENTAFIYVKGMINNDTNIASNPSQKKTYFLDGIIFWNVGISWTRQLNRKYDAGDYTDDIGSFRFEWFKSALVLATYTQIADFGESSNELQIRKDSETQFTIKSKDTGSGDMDLFFTFHG